MRMPFEQALPAETVLGEQWVQIARQDVLDPHLLDSLGTRQFLFCDYVKMPSEPERDQLLATLRRLNLAGQQEELNRLRSRNAVAVELGLTYYTETVTVAHIPEVCYLGGGYNPKDNRKLTWSWKDPATKQTRTLDVRFLTYENPLNHGVRHIAYFFRANGKYESDAYEVRVILSDLFERRAYYAKVEMSCDGMSAQQAEQAMRQLLERLLPEVERALPQ